MAALSTIAAIGTLAATAYGMTRKQKTPKVPPPPTPEPPVAQPESGESAFLESEKKRFGKRKTIIAGQLVPANISKRSILG